MLFRSQRDTESLAKRNRRIKLTNKKRSVLNHQINNACPDIIACETELSAYSSNTVNVQRFKEYIQKKHEKNLGAIGYHGTQTARHKQYKEDKYNMFIRWTHL